MHAAISASKSLTIAISSDKGLCGGLNSNISKYTRTLLRMNESTSECWSMHTSSMFMHARLMGCHALNACS